MTDILVNFFQGLPPEWIVVIISAMPVSELRGAIPLGVMMHLNVFKVFFLAIAGNMIPVLPLLYLLDPVSKKLRRSKPWEKFFDWLFARTRKKSELVEKYEFWGLLFLVAIPLPMTGAWTGSIAASLFGLNKKLSFIAVTAGVVAAAVIVTILTLGTKGLFAHV